jgi:hypothetical protein
MDEEERILPHVVVSGDVIFEVRLIHCHFLLERVLVERANETSIAPAHTHQQSNQAATNSNLAREKVQTVQATYISFMSCRCCSLVSANASTTMPSTIAIAMHGTKRMKERP